MPPGEPTTVSRAIARVLDLYAGMDLLTVEWQASTEHVRAFGGPDEHIGEWSGPWVLLKLGQPSEGEPPAWAVHELAIWRTTGDVHVVRGGEVLDPPILHGGLRVAPTLRGCGHDGWQAGCPDCEREERAARDAMGDT